MLSGRFFLSLSATQLFVVYHKVEKRTETDSEL